MVSELLMLLGYRSDLGCYPLRVCDQICWFLVVNLICLEGVKRLGETVPFLLFLSLCIVESRHSC
ncbi:hypothetical protein Hanom_Chr04g00374121 [Helianthus anomalus]